MGATTVGIPVRLVLKTDKTRPDSFAATLNFSPVRGECSNHARAGSETRGGNHYGGKICQTIPARVIWVREDEFSNSTIAGLKFLP